MPRDIVGTGDFDGDGHVNDIIWQDRNTGERYIWLMTGTQRTGGASLGHWATEWQIRNH